MSIACSICGCTTWKCVSALRIEEQAIFSTDTGRMEYRQLSVNTENVGDWKCTNGHTSTNEEYDLIIESEPIFEIKNP